MMKRNTVNLLMAGLGLWALTGSLQASEEGKELFMKKCGSCHMTARPSNPADMSKMVAPPVPGVAMHVKMKYPDKEAAVAFIKDYVIHPARAKAQCMPRTIQRFGLMPSQKGNVTEEELEKIAEYIVDNYPDQQFVRMHQQRQGMMGQQGMKGQQKGMGKQGGMKKASPFLIHKGLPHLSKLLMQRWDDLDLDLSDEQKAKLLPIRKETMAGVRQYKPQVMQLERKIRQAIFAGADPETLKSDVEKLAELKKKLTMIHLRCIARTKKVLTPQQFAMLVPGKGGKGMGQGMGNKGQGGGMKSRGGCGAK